MQIFSGVLPFPFFALARKGKIKTSKQKPSLRNICLFKVSFPWQVIYRFLTASLILPGNYLLKEICSLGWAVPLTPLAHSSLEASKGVLQCLGTHLEGPLDASTSPVRQQSLQPERAAAEFMYSTTEPASVLSCSEPGGTAQGRQGGCEDSKGSAGNSELGDPSRSLLPLCFKSMQGLYSSGMRIFQKMSAPQSKWHLLGNWIWGKRDRERERG